MCGVRACERLRTLGAVERAVLAVISSVGSDSRREVIEESGQVHYFETREPPTLQVVVQRVVACDGLLGAGVRAQLNCAYVSGVALTRWIGWK
jgi:hypothetical protein